MFCFHKYGKVEGDFQYCVKCGKARAKPIVPCDHKWKEKANIKEQGSGIIVGYLLQCEKCGNMQKYSIND